MASIAQLVERWTATQHVAGSNPLRNIKLQTQTTIIVVCTIIVSIEPLRYYVNLTVGSNPSASTSKLQSGIHSLMVKNAMVLLSFKSTLNM